MSGVHGAGPGADPAMLARLAEAGRKSLGKSADPASGEPGRGITIASYNVENLFDDVDDPDRDDEGTPVKTEASQEALASALRDADADVVALQEVENRQVLDDFVDRHLGKDAYPYRVLVEGNDRRGIDVALLSKYPITRQVSHKDETFPLEGGKTRKMSRDVLEATIQAEGGYEFTVFNTHLKAGKGRRNESIRNAEAAHLRSLLDRHEGKYPNSRYVVTGDFNSLPDSKAVKTVRGQGQNPLYDPFEGLPDKESYSHPTDDWTPPRRIDYLLMSQGMREDLDPRSPRVVRTASAEASDHFPISATLNPPEA